MSLPKNEAAISAVHRPAIAVPPLEMRSGVQARFVAPGSVTRGQFGLFEWHMPPHAGGPQPHYHKTFSESFYVISGTVRLYDGNRWVDGEAGDFVYVPENGIHAFRNDADAAASMLILFAPGAPRERYFEELAAIAASGRVLTDEQWLDLLARHDQYRAP